MIPVRQVHELLIGSADEDDHPGHIAAASSLVRYEGSLFVVADDELSLAIFDANDLGHGHLIRILPGELPTDTDERKEEKPDLESLALLPEHSGFPHRALLTLGSGSSKKRLKGALIPLTSDGAASREHRDIDLSDLFAGLGETITDLNIEGCAALGDRMYLAQRGNSAEAHNSLIALDLEAMCEQLAGGALSRDLVVDMHEYDLGQLRGVDLSFSDLSPLPDGRLVFSTSAEDSTGTVTDGEIYGSALGVVRPGSDIEYHEPVDGFVKIEGIDASTVEEGIEVMIVMDADDPSKPSPLLGATII